MIVSVYIIFTLIPLLTIARKEYTNDDNSTSCGCTDCYGSYCVKDKLQCKYNDDDNPLIDDPDEVMAGIIAYFGSPPAYSDIHIKPGSHTVWIFDDYLYARASDVCYAIPRCVAYELRVLGGTKPYGEIGFAWGCNGWSSRKKAQIYINFNRANKHNAMNTPNKLLPSWDTRNNIYVAYNNASKTPSESDNVESSSSKKCPASCSRCYYSRLAYNYCVKDNVQCDYLDDDREKIWNYGNFDPDDDSIYLDDGDTVWHVNGNPDEVIDRVAMICDMVPHCVGFDYKPFDESPPYAEVSFALGCSEPSERPGGQIHINMDITDIMASTVQSPLPTEKNNYVSYKNAKAQSESEVVDLTSSSGTCPTTSCRRCYTPILNTYCIKDNLQCNYNGDDDPLINDPNEVMNGMTAAFGYKPGEDLTYLKSGSNTIWIMRGDVRWLDVQVAMICDNIPRCVAFEFEPFDIFPHPYAEISFAWGCNEYSEWPGGQIQINTGKIDVQSAMGDHIKYLPSLDNSKVNKRIGDVYYYLTAAVIACLFFAIGICLGLAIKKKQKKVQYPEL